MSWPIGKVPKGWVRGETLRTIGGGPRYALDRPLSVPGPGGTIGVDEGGFVIEFDCYRDLCEWLGWWYDKGTLRMDAKTFNRKRDVLIAYLKEKIDESDWHAVSDAANDLRCLEAANPEH